MTTDNPQTVDHQVVDGGAPRCPSCGNTGWECVVCGHLLDDGRDHCAAHHPEYGFTCILPKHNGPHFDMSGGHWDQHRGQLLFTARREGPRPPNATGQMHGSCHVCPCDEPVMVRGGGVDDPGVCECGHYLFLHCDEPVAP